ncbi:MAG TPA: hypothetical protein VF040_14055 [Ktedonobacterales bacterium]
MNDARLASQMWVDIATEGIAALGCILRQQVGTWQRAVDRGAVVVQRLAALSKECVQPIKRHVA